MASVLSFPMRNDLTQYSFNITLSGAVFNFQIIFNVRMNRWTMNINDNLGNTILAGVPVLINRNLYNQYGYLSLPEGPMIAIDNTGQDSQPTQLSFGTQNSMYYVDPTT